MTGPVYVEVSCAAQELNHTGCAEACSYAVVGAEACAVEGLVGRSRAVLRLRLVGGSLVVEDRLKVHHLEYRTVSCCRVSGRMLLRHR